MARYLGTGTSGAGFDMVFDVSADTGPGIGVPNEFECTVLTEMTGQWVIMTIPEYLEMEIVRIRNVDAIVSTKETGRISGPTRVRRAGKQ